MKWKLKNGAEVSVTSGEKISVIGPGFRWSAANVVFMLICCMWVCLICTAAYRLVAEWDRTPFWMPVPMALYFAVTQFGLTRGLMLLGERDQFTCTHSEFSYQRCRFGRLIENSTIASGSITRVLYGVHRRMKSGAIYGLVVETPGCMLKALPGISAIEAEQLLSELEKFGVKVFHDPPLPMAADIEKNGWFVNPWAKS